MNLDWMGRSIQISYGVPHQIYTGYYPPEANPKYRIVQYQDGPTGSACDNFLKYHRQNPKSIVATCSFRSGNYLARLENALGKENVEWHFGPTVPGVQEEHDSFNQKTFLWAYRNFCKYADDNPNGMRKLFNKISDYMRVDSDYKLVILAQPHNETSQKALQGDCKAWFFSFPFSSELKKYKDRVEVLTNIHWCEVLELMSKTKLVISPAEPLGGPPFEAASYGIPMLLEQSTNPFIDDKKTPMFSNLITVQKGLSDSFFNKLDQLFDSNYYRTCGNSYRSFVKKHATYESYVNKLEQIAQKRGWE
jgi:hypothetical protein